MGSVAAASPLRGGGYNATEMDSGGDLEQHMNRAQLQQYYEQKQKSHYHSRDFVLATQ